MYTGACVFADNSFLIARTGPANSNLIDPDNAVLIYTKVLLPNGNKKDTLIIMPPLIVEKAELEEILIRISKGVSTLNKLKK